MNIAEIEIRLSELVGRPFAADEFPLQLADIYNAPKATITKLRQGGQNRADRAGDLLWKNKLYYRSADKGAAAITVDELKTRKPAKSHKPRFIIATDGDELSALDTKADDTLHCSYRELNNHFDFFLPLAGIDRYEAVKENPADIKAAGKLAKFHDEIIKKNPDWSSPAKRHELNLFITRVLFCLFAEDTGIFEPGVFTKAITEMGGDEGVQLKSVLKQIFDSMNLPVVERGVKSALIRDFPYVNGGLFAEQTAVPCFNKRTVRILIEAAQLDWRGINPDIFGSMIQAVVEPEMRGDLGMHYTSVPNIMKVLQPLFLMSLEEEHRAAGSNGKKLHKLLVRISKIRVFDPACGSGNFLIIAYRELRGLEMRIWGQLRQIEKQGCLPFSRISLSNFYGIEYADFAAETAKLSLWIAEHQMNIRFKDLFGSAPPILPLQNGGGIYHGNALRLDWLKICPSPTKKMNKEKIFDLATIVPIHATEDVIDDEVETYIVGNPPYLGSRNQTKEQKQDMRVVFEEKFQSFKALDYVCSWYFKAACYCSVQNSQAAFVATNSICQGSQVPVLWPKVLGMGLEIGFAYRSFKWRNNAAKNAGVTCVIVGIRKAQNAPKIIFDGNLSVLARNISPYLIDIDSIYIAKANKPISSLEEMTYGNYPGDGNYLTLSLEERKSLIEQHPNAVRLVRRLYGAQEFLKGIERWCLWIDDIDLELARSIPFINERIERTRSVRLGSCDPGYNKLASRSHQYRDRNVHDDYTIIVPTISSERREYFPVGLITDRAVTTNQVFALHDAPMYYFSLLASRIHYSWVRAVAGRLKTDIRYSSTLTYNTFPVHPMRVAEKTALADQAWELLAVREKHPGKTIAWLYDPHTMPEDLRKAHQTLDDTLERIYIGRPFKNDTERLEHLFKLYAEVTETADRKLKIAHA